MQTHPKEQHPNRSHQRPQWFPGGRALTAAQLQSLTHGRRVGVVMSAGFFGFYGHIGFLLGLKELGIEGVACTGTSAGAMTGAFYASGMPPSEMARKAVAITKADFWDPQSPWHLAASLVRGGQGFMGLLKTNRLRAGFERELPVKRFEECVIPFATVATNLSTRSHHVDRSGDLAEAVVASSAFPIMFAPVPRSTGHLHWDGGILDKTPIQTLLTLTPVDVVVMHYLPPSTMRWANGFHLTQLASAWRALDACFDLARHRETLHQVAAANARGVDVVVAHPVLPKVGPNTMHRAPRALEAARRHTVRDGAFHLFAARQP